MSQATTSLRPKASSFLFQRLVPMAVVLFIVAMAGAIAAIAVDMAALVAVAIGVPALLMALSVWSARIAYRKEVYEVSPTNLVARSGGIFSDRQTDLEFRNVTHVKQRLAWPRYRLFNVGDVIVESAGSSSSEIVFRSVPDPDRVYAMIRERLQDNGYSLQQRTLLHEEQPDPLGAFIDVIGAGIGGGFAAVWFLGGFALDATGSIAELTKGATGLTTLARIVMFIGVPSLIIATGVVLLVLHYLDLRRRVYRVYDDTVVYEEGFLSRHNAFMPAENIADADIKRTLVDRVLDLADVTVSCQGSGQEVKFRRLKQAEALKRAIGHLVASAGERPGSQRRSPADAALDAGGDGARGTPRSSEPVDATRSVPPEEAWTAELRPVPKRAAMSVIGLLPLFPAWVLATGSVWAQTSARTYVIGPRAASTRGGVLSTNDTAYTYDKVTGVAVKVGPFDRMMGTMTIEIWTIGSTMPLVLAHVRSDEVDLPRLLRQLGIPSSPPLRALPMSFGLANWLKASPGALVLSLLGMAACIVGAVLAETAAVMALALIPVTWLGVRFAVARARTARQRCTFHARHMELETGLFWRDHTYARYDNVKKIEVTRFPGGVSGLLKVYVAGERLVQDNQKKGGMPVPYSLTAHYVEDVSDLSAWMDEVLDQTRSPGDTSAPIPVQALLEARPMLGNSVVAALMLSVLMPPLALLIVPLTVLSVRRRSYRLERRRVVALKGILYRQTSSVLYRRIDSLNQRQGALGKAFGNGDVTLFTAGSSRPDLALQAMKNFAEVYQAVRAEYADR